MPIGWHHQLFPFRSKLLENADLGTVTWYQLLRPVRLSRQPPCPVLACVWLREPFSHCPVLWRSRSRLLIFTFQFVNCSRCCCLWLLVLCRCPFVRSRRLRSGDGLAIQFSLSTFLFARRVLDMSASHLQVVFDLASNTARPASPSKPQRFLICSSHPNRATSNSAAVKNGAARTGAAADPSTSGMSMLSLASNCPRR